MNKRNVPMRTCVGCREVKPKRELVRVVRTPDGRVALDPSGKMSGRGAYVCPKEGCLKAAVRRNALGRALQAEVGPETVETISRELNSMREGVEAAELSSPEEPIRGKDGI